MNRFEEIVWGGLIANVTKGKQEFFDCNPANYKREEGESEVIAYFLVHEGKKVGDMSQYGELRKLA